MIKKITLALVVLLVAIQLIPMEKNESGPTEFDITKSYNVPDNVSMILKGACNDCHSNTTVYPWYSKVQPVGFWLNHHVDEGKGHLNFSEFTKIPLRVQNHKFEEIVETVESGEITPTAACIPKQTCPVSKDKYSSTGLKSKWLCWLPSIRQTV